MFRTYRQIIAIGIMLIACIALYAKPISVLEETEDYVKVKFILPEWSLQKTTENNEIWQKIVCDEGASLDKEGYPLLIAFSEAVGIPADGDISIEVLSQTNQTVTNINIIPVRKMTAKGEVVSYEFFQNPNAYSRSVLYPNVFTEKGVDAFIGNRHMIPIHLYPFQYNAYRKELTVTNEAILVIHINGRKQHAANSITATNYIDSEADDFFLNNRTSTHWRKDREKDPGTQSMPKSFSSLVNEIQLIVDSEGIYKITYQYLHDKMQLMADSLNIEYEWNVDNVDPRYLELKNENGPVAIHFHGETDGEFNPGDYFEFYGDRHYGETLYQDDYTAENVYTLFLADHLGGRMAVENGGLVESNPSRYIVPDMFESTIHLEEQFIPDKLGRSWSLDSNFYREDVWFWKKITAPNLEIVPFQLQYPKDINIRSFSTKVSLYGLTYSPTLFEGEFDHKASIRLNQSLVNTISWRDQREQIFTNSEPLPNSYLNHGTNYYYISLSGETPMQDREQILLDYIELTYWREYKTSENFIKFTKPSFKGRGLYQFKLEGFTSDQVSVYKIGSSIFNNMQIEPFTQNGGQPWTVTFQDSVVSQDITYYAVTEGLKKQPKDFRLNLPSQLKYPDNAADCVVITGRAFIDDEGTLLYKQQWESLGYQVKLVDVQDIFDEFNHGIRSAESIKDFISYAYNNWSEPQLKSVVLLGEGTDDERDNSQSRKFNIIPVKKIWTNEHGATAADNWYGCIVGPDPIPDVSVARINVWKNDQIIQVAQKSQKYITQPQFEDLWHGHIILSSGGKQSDTSDIFAQQSEIIRRSMIPDFYRVSRVYTNTLTVSQEFQGLTTALLDKMNEGAVYLQFMGHGGGRIWADFNLFNFSNVASLNNTNYPIVSSLACYCSAFDTNGSASISEALVLEPNKGAIATIGFTGLGYENTDLDFGIALNDAMFDKDFNSLGEAVNFAKARLFVVAINPAPRYALTQGCALLGDPNIKIIKPVRNISVSTNKDNFNVNDTIRVTAVIPNQSIAARTFVFRSTEIADNPPNENIVLNNQYNYSYKLTGAANSSYQRRIFVSSYSPTAEYCGFKDISVGRGLAADLGTIPALPTWNDSIFFKTKITGINNIRSLYCKVRYDTLSINPVTLNIPLVRSGADTTVYVTQNGVPPQNTGKEIYYKFVVTDTSNVVTESYKYSVVIAGPEMIMEDMQFVTDNTELGVKVLVRNVGNTASPATNIKLTAYPFTSDPVELVNRTFAPLEINAKRWEYMSVDTLFSDNVVLMASVNEPFLFPEWSYYDTNNSLTLTLPFNYQVVTNTGGQLHSSDNNIFCEVPANLVPTGHASMFYLNKADAVTAVDEPDVAELKLASGVASTPYEIMTLDSTIVDSTGVLVNGNKLKLTFFYSSTDEDTQQYENENSYMIYRWEPEYKKWLLQGGNISVSENKVIFLVSRTGIYSLFRNKDKIRPSIDVNVQDQEFTVGGYISGTGTISLLLSDANGINVIDNSIRLFLDGVQIPESQWVKTINKDNINRIPIKYQLNLQKGNYTLVVDCVDVNGNFNSRDVQFVVNDEFDVIHLANYPNPVLGKTQDPKNAGRTRFTYVLTDDADEVTIKVFTVSGRLVRTFKNLPTGVGYHEYPRTVYAWDCSDEEGFYLANGVYFYRLIAQKGNKSIEKLQKMAIVK